MVILVLNCGSSSIKYQVIDMEQTGSTLLAKGLVERIGLSDGVLTHKPVGRENFELHRAIPDHTTGIRLVLDALTDPAHGVVGSLDEIKAVGHRVAHGGEFFPQSCIVDEDVKRKIRSLFEIAPLHNPANLEGVLSIEKVLPGTPQVTVFDTSFHQTIPAMNYLYALPHAYYEKYRVRKYGFHGTSHHYVARKGAELAGLDYEKSKIVTCHIGNGASVTAVLDGKSYDTSMGFSPLDGLVMGTRCGAIDASAITFIGAKEGMSYAELDEMMNILAAILKDPEAVVSTPTWQNHVAIFEQAGFKVGKYPYYDKENNGVDFPAMLESLNGLKENTVVILHACCHNPTGYDLTQEQWAQVVDVCVKNKLIPFLDIAYQGFGDGLEEDAGSIRQFADAGIPFFVSSSFSKSFSLYGERIGALTVVCKDQEEASRVMSKLKALIRANYSNPPAHGAKIVAQVLNDPKLMAQWHEDLSEMRERIKEMRKDLAAELKALGAKKDFDFVTQQKGMFSFSGLNPEQVQRLKDEFGVYIVKSGRMCVASLNKDNVKYTAEAIKEVL